MFTAGVHMQRHNRSEIYQRVHM